MTVATGQLLVAGHPLATNHVLATDQPLVASQPLATDRSFHCQFLPMHLSPLLVTNIFIRPLPSTIHHTGPTCLQIKRETMKLYLPMILEQ